MVGAGPAGSATAIMLAQAGLKVLIIDEARSTARKVGESLPAAVKRLLVRLGINGIQDLLSPHEYRASVANASAWGSDKWVYRNAIQNPEGTGWQVIRNQLDAALYQRALDAGAIAYEGRVNQVKALPQGFKLSFLHSKKTLIVPALMDATGRSAKLSRELGAEAVSFGKQTAVAAWFSSAEDPDQVIRIRSVKDGWWYTAVLPNQERVAVFHGLPARVSALARDPEAFVAAFNQAKIRAQAFKVNDLATSLTTHDAGARRMHLPIGPQLLAVGDAILSFDPLSSQGIFFALYSGILAAEAVLHARESQNWNQEQQAYFSAVDRVMEHQHSARIQFYAGEQRFPNEPYWREQR